MAVNNAHWSKEERERPDIALLHINQTSPCKKIRFCHFLIQKEFGRSDLIGIANLPICQGVATNVSEVSENAQPSEASQGREQKRCSQSQHNNPKNETNPQRNKRGCGKFCQHERSWFCGLSAQDLRCEFLSRPPKWCIHEEFGGFCCECGFTKKQLEELKKKTKTKKKTESNWFVWKVWRTIFFRSLKNLLICFL